MPEYATPLRLQGALGRPAERSPATASVRSPDDAVAALAEAIGVQTRQNQEFMGRMATDLSRRSPSSDGESISERVSPLTGIKIEQHIPQIQDSNTDLDWHLAEFRNILDCHAFGRRRVRAWDRLTLMKHCFPPGSARLLIYNGETRRARRRCRLPMEADEVFNEIIT